MCLVLVDYLQPKTTQVCIEWTILALFWVDILLQTSYRSLSEQKYVGFESTRYNIKIVLILLITLDEVLAVCHHEFRLLVILRAGMCQFMVRAAPTVGYFPAQEDGLRGSAL